VISRGWLDGWATAVGRDAENAHIGRFTDVTSGSSTTKAATS
jgi:hypothetical protein